MHPEKEKGQGQKSAEINPTPKTVGEQKSCHFKNVGAVSRREKKKQRKHYTVFTSNISDVERIVQKTNISVRMLNAVHTHACNLSAFNR